MPIFDTTSTCIPPHTPPCYQLYRLKRKNLLLSQPVIQSLKEVVPDNQTSAQKNKGGVFSVAKVTEFFDAPNFILSGGSL